MAGTIRPMQDRAKSLRLDQDVVAEVIATSREVAQHAAAVVRQARRLCEQSRAVRAARAQQAPAVAAGGTLKR